MAKCVDFARFYILKSLKSQAELDLNLFLFLTNLSLKLCSYKSHHPPGNSWIHCYTMIYNKIRQYDEVTWDITAIYLGSQNVAPALIAFSIVGADRGHYNNAKMYHQLGTKQKILSFLHFCEFFTFLYHLWAFPSPHTKIF